MAYIKFGSSWKIQSPCNGCNNRCIGCHSQCVEYADYQQRLFAFKKAIFNSKDKEDLVTGYVTKEKIKNAHAKTWER